MSQLHSALTQLFKKHRIVFWYDHKRELRGEFESLIFPEIEMIELANNEFYVKYHVLVEKPDQKFLIYHAGPPPADLDNWLLDVQLAQGEFRADQAALWLSDLGLGPEFIDLVQAHEGFLADEARRFMLKGRIEKEDTASSIRMKMLAVCAEAEPRLDDILEALLAELAQDASEKMDLICRSSLDAFLWERCARAYGYQSGAPGIQDFAIELFKSCYALSIGSTARFGHDALVFLKRWKDSIRHHAAFETLSEKYAQVLNIEQELQTQDFRKLVEMDIFRLIDKKIISELARHVSERTITPADVSTIIRQRRAGHWYSEFQHLYDAIDYASQLINALQNQHLDLSITSFGEGVQRYTQTWYRLDQLYRKVIYHARKAGHTSVLERLVELVENHYTNNFLLVINNNWQPFIDACSTWDGGPMPLQKEFFERFVNQPYLANKKKIYVIISDAFRYEIAEELVGRIRREDRYMAEYTPMLSMLPSYTQLGMAALLPNKEIAFADNDSGTVAVDGINTQGTPNREKILKQAVGQAAAIRADSLLSMSRDDCRALLRENDVVYIYHNHIDAVGDKKDSEERVFEAVEETMEELLTMVKKLTAANATNILITADHGFIYQNRPIEESDFSASDISGREILYRERRFALGKGLNPQPSLKSFKSADAGLAGDMEIQIPKSIHRLRLKGSGSRYVHGGSALQEIVIPVIQVNKKRESDITMVGVDILKGPSSLITSGQFSVTFFQTEPVSDKVQPRKLRAGIYTGAGELISDRHELNFDLGDENARGREMMVRFILTRESNQVNNQQVFLRLEEQVGSTTHYQEYKSISYTMRRSFTSDFDF
ncbi:MAG TPA: BREX-1 system phosphatase PglZ type A [Anaerolineaceae bacterium]|nr:BREX-1 system phosphatase PglZ type A [Anaerolineaceae bacterium]HPN52270.1 BREX-1 system phosphatase PglZ type A [Anaerolineaceae bacterium]